LPLAAFVMDTGCEGMVSHWYKILLSIELYYNYWAK
jgi:hypothetical protein